MTRLLRKAFWVALAAALLCPLLATGQEDPADTLYRSGVADKEAGKIDQAIAEFTGAINTNPNHYGARFALGWCYVGQGKVEEAKQQFTEVVRLAPNTTEGQSAARALKRLGAPVPVTAPPAATTPATPATPGAAPTTTAPTQLKPPTAVGQTLVHRAPSWTWIVAIILGVIGLIIGGAMLGGGDNNGGYVLMGCGFVLPLVFFEMTAMYTMYGWPGGLIINFIYAPLVFLGSLLGFIPVIGQVLYWLVESRWLTPAFHSWFPNIGDSWLLHMLYWQGLISTISFSMVSIGAMNK